MDSPQVTPDSAVKSTEHMPTLLRGKPTSAEETQAPKKPRRCKSHVAKHFSTTVDEICTHRDTAVCFMNSTLADAADEFIRSNRTAAVVMESGGGIIGVLTENDILGAFVDSAPWDCSLDRWLQGEDARLPGRLIPAMMLPPDTSLAEAAACMASMAEDDTNFACHHLLVRRSSTGTGDNFMQPNWRLLSALDIAVGMLEAARAEAAGALTPDTCAASKAAAMTVSQAMKPRALAATCTLDATLADAFVELFTSRQNCALVISSPQSSEAVRNISVESEGEVQEVEPLHQQLEDEGIQSVGGGPIYGVITTSDAIRAFSERITGEHTSLAGWLRGLAQERITAAQRAVAADDSLVNASATLASTGVHHLLVLDRATQEVTGVLSALDIVIAMGVNWLFEEVEEPQ
eukprot:TRINITY_DN102859_c0_g1_i1.p1 TRINITY_DN102859_c0_g1~~TRINITY_DN102859_c0_g1_i1.p1  ORF type:complete len:422 (-),score=81.46 TRINITY_DN102859_c0_g1_i1:55-1269(-)